MNQPKESMSAINNKVVNIQHYLAGVQRDMNALAQQQQLWREEKREWEEASVALVERAEGKLKAELREIEKEIKRRDERCREAVETIHGRITSIQAIQNKCGFLVSQLHRRLGDIQAVLGGK